MWFRVVTAKAAHSTNAPYNNFSSADVAQLVEQLIRNEQVTGSIPAIGSIFIWSVFGVFWSAVDLVEVHA